MCFPLWGARSSRDLYPEPRTLFRSKAQHNDIALANSRTLTRKLLQLRILRFGFFQDGNAGVSVSPDGKQLLEPVTLKLLQLTGTRRSWQ